MTSSAKAKDMEEKDAAKSAAKADAKAAKDGDTKGVADQPENKLNNLRDNSVSASEMAAKKGASKSKLAASDDTTEAIATETAETAKEEDQSIAARLARTGYVLNENQITGERWVGLSVQLDPDADAAAKARTRVTSIAEIAPRKGLTVKPKDGEPFVVGEEFDRDSSPADWFAVLGADKKPFLS